MGGSQLERGELEGARRQRDLEQRHQLLLQQVGVAWGGRGLRGRGHPGGRGLLRRGVVKVYGRGLNAKLGRLF